MLLKILIQDVFIWQIFIICASCTKNNYDPTLELAFIISAECIQCDSIEKSLTGTTVLNRLNHPKYPKDIRSVIIDGYDGYCQEWYIYDKQCYEIAEKLINGCPRDTNILFFYGKRDKKPRYITEIVYRERYHNFGY